MIEKIYFDMDGVLVDFKRGIVELAGVDVNESDEEMWIKVKNVDHFYYKLKPLDNQLEVFKRVNEKYNGIVEILTAIPKPKRNIKDAKSDKIKWVLENIGVIPVNVVYSNEKRDYAKNKNYILIDDSIRNINEWEEHGGTGIHYTNDVDIIEKLETLDRRAPKKLVYNLKNNKTC